MPLSAITSAVLVLFVYSGMLKWIPFFPVDPTILFGGSLATIAGIRTVTGVRRVNRLSQMAILSTFAFFAWYLFTAVYSVSDYFWQYKAMTLQLSVLAFVAPILYFRTEAHFVWFDRALVAAALLATVIVLGFYLTGSIELLLRQGSDTNTLATLIPNYLQLGSVIGIGILLCLAGPTVPSGFVAISGFAALFVLGARGPILFTTAMAMFGYLLYTRARQFKRLSFAKYGVVLAAAIIGFYSWPGAGRALQRFSAMLTDPTALAQGFRLPEFTIAGDVIAASPVFGVGLGGYGAAALGVDENLYPHNLFLEAYAEGGILALTLLIVNVVSIAAVAFAGRQSRRGLTYIILATFYLLNYSKSGGFVGTRDLYMVFGVLIAYMNLRPGPSPDCNTTQRYAIHA